MVWQSKREEYSLPDIYAQMFESDGSKLGDEFRVNTYTPDQQLNPAVAGLSNGGFVVVWESDKQDGDEFGIYARRFGSDGSPYDTEEEFRVNTATANRQWLPSVAGLPDGKFVVVWQGYFNNECGVCAPDIYARVLDNSGTPQGGEFMVNESGVPNSPGENSPFVAPISSGGFVVAWAVASGQAWAKIFKSDGTAVGAQFVLSYQQDEWDANPVLASIGNGRFAAVWETDTRNPETSSDLFGRVFDNNGNKVCNDVLCLPFSANTCTANYQGKPSIASASNGEFVVVWYSAGQDGSGKGIFGQRFNSEGAKIGEEFLVNKVTTGDQTSPSIAPLSGARFVVVWTGIDGNGTGIIGRVLTMAEICNGLDDDCDGETDEDWPEKGLPCDGDDTDVCMEGKFVCKLDGSGVECDDKTGNNKEECWNGKDDDCDGETDENEEGADKCVEYYYDNDGDTYGTDSSRCLCEALEKYTALKSGDCDDNDASVHPGASEICNDRDDDCDGTTDEDFLTKGQPCDGSDTDLCEEGVLVCKPDGTGVECNEDPKQNNAEVCNGLDDDCDGTTDEERVDGLCGTDGYLLYYWDKDEDGFGVDGDSKCLCALSETYTAQCSGDCDDTNPSVHPGGACGAPGTPLCGADGDCNGSFLDALEICDDGNSVRWDGCTDCKYLEILVNTWTTDSQVSPSVSPLSNGGFVVVWQSLLQDGSGFGIYSQRFDAKGKKLGVEFRVNKVTAGSQRSPSVAPTPMGGFVVVWDSNNRIISSDVYGQAFDGDGKKKGSEFLVNTWTTGDQKRPWVASFLDGGFVVVWQSWKQAGPDWDVFGQRYGARVVKAGNEFRVNTWTSGHQQAPCVASLSDGGFVVVWESLRQDHYGWGVFGQRFDKDGNKVGAEFRANTENKGDQAYPFVTSLPHDGFVVVWQSFGQDGEDWGVFGQRFDGNGTKVGDEFQANSWTIGYQGNPSVASLSGGGFVVVWGSSFWETFGNDEFSYYGIRGQRFDSYGNKVGEEFEVNTWPTPYCGSPSIARLSVKGIVTVWQGMGETDPNTGIYARILGQAFP